MYQPSDYGRYVASILIASARDQLITESSRLAQKCKCKAAIMSENVLVRAERGGCAVKQTIPRITILYLKLEEGKLF
jgi:hypothetical protein